MKSETEAIGYLYGLQGRGMKFGLSGIRGLLRDLGNPEKTLRSIHIAGSNGKGSTAALIASVLTTEGYRTGLYTSPHLISFRERIRIDGKPVPGRRIVEYVRLLKPGIESRKATFFEAVTAIAFRYFADEAVDYAVIEAGLGGRLDATNVLKPLVSVITSISLEHTEILGNSLKAIAYEKAGIIKRGVPCVSGVVETAAKGVLRRVCREKGSGLTELTPRAVTVEQSDLRGSTAVMRLPDGTGGRFAIGLAGSFQARNAVVAYAALRELSGRGVRLTQKGIRRGFADVAARTGFRGRISAVRRHPLTIVDVAHNPEAIRKLVGALQGMGLRKMTVVFGVMRDKKMPPMINALASIARRAAAVQPRTERARSAGDIAEAFRRRHIPVFFIGNVRDGVRRARREAGRNGAVLITGSHFVAGEALAMLERKIYLTINQ